MEEIVKSCIKTGHGIFDRGSLEPIPDPGKGLVPIPDPGSKTYDLGYFCCDVYAPREVIEEAFVNKHIAVNLDGIVYKVIEIGKTCIDTSETDELDVFPVILRRL